jgi:beta-N-acetylhexosaminidase
MLSAFIAGLAGSRLDAREAALLRAARPCGVILFARNIETPEQVRRLTGDVRTAIGADDLLVLIDQEGGRVQRLRPPHWRVLPPAAAYARLYQRDAQAALRST